MFFQTLAHKDGSKNQDFVSLTKSWLHKVSPVIGILEEEASDSELAAFISYAIAFPSGFMALVDTYDVMKLVRKSIYISGILC